MCDSANAKKKMDRVTAPGRRPEEDPGWGGELEAMAVHARLCRDWPETLPAYSRTLEMNPSLRLFDNRWSGLTRLLDGLPGPPAKGPEMVMIWRRPEDGGVASRPVRNDDLLALKMAAENLTSAQVSSQSGTCRAAIDDLLLRALASGLITGPEPGILRQRPVVDPGREGSPPDPGTLKYRRPRMFALQWHITQACDLHCRHCYDRRPSPTLSRSREIGLLDQFAEFTARRNLLGQVTFTGGNPLMHPRFHELYRGAAERGFATGILGNPCPEAELDRICQVQIPSFFQVSLEGLAPHNDYMRGEGHFHRSLSFLDLLRKRGIYAKVMLTLTRANQDQVIPLGRFLQGRADLFTFNRLSLEGEGAALEMADTQGYAAFLEAYAGAAETSPVMGFKDNLFTPLFRKTGRPVFGGCTGFGCGAAFNFVSILPGGAVHACRKFHSPIGDLTRDTLETIYTSRAARKYREGPEACRSCEFYYACRGCLASTRSAGQDPFTDRDPYCFKD